ncbi:hypothetical protein HDE_10476 [Halotydeus destructor]|nr:hypothetical protein HDE_10476 [Halotydeus destructor]
MSASGQQEFVVLRCKQCSMFQVHQSKKSPKFSCKVCGEKQSISKVLYKGSSSECRTVVQRLNTICSQADDDEVNRELMKYEDEMYESRFDGSNDRPTNGTCVEDIEGNHVIIESNSNDDSNQIICRHVPIDYSMNRNSVNLSTIQEVMDMIIDHESPKPKRKKWAMFAE